MTEKVYEYLLVSAGQFKVKKRWKDKEGIKHLVIHLVSHKKGKWHCDCDGFKFTHNCHHIDWIEEAIRERNWLTIRYEEEVDKIDDLRYKKDDVQTN